MNATAPNVEPEVLSTEGPTTNVEEHDHNVQYVTRDVFKAIKKQQQHFQRIAKKRELRWSQPFADAKIEDLNFVIERLMYQIELTRKALYMKGVITKEDITAALERDKQRMAKAEELRNNTTMSVDEKKAVALEWDIPLEVLGIVEEQPKENG